MIATYRKIDQLVETATARANWELQVKGFQRATLADYWKDEEAQEYERLQMELDAYYEEEMCGSY